jgi:GcrA cell cycle regulator
MQSSNWPPEHSQALREYLARSMSYSEIAQAINTKFGTAYSRNAALGRAKRMGLGGPGPGPDRPDERPKPPPKANRPWLEKLCKRVAPELTRPMPILERAEPVKLRCIEIDPRHLSLLELERGDCRYPYGRDADGDAITFCGHPRRRGSSYCAPHFHLTRGPGTIAERAAVPASLRLVEAA